MLETDNESQLQLWIHSYLNTSAEMTVDNKPPLDWQTSFKPAVDAENPDAARRESCKPQLWAADRGERWWWSAEEESGCRERERESPRTEMHKKKIFWLSLQTKVYISQRASWLFRILRKSIPLQRSSTRLLLTPSCRQLRGIHWLPRAIRTRSVESKKQRTFGV